MKQFIYFFRGGRAFQPCIARLNEDQHKKYEENMLKWFQELVECAVRWGQAHIVQNLLTPPLLFWLSVLPLHVAVYHDHSGDVLKVLLECKQHLPDEEAEIQLFSGDGVTPLHLAAQCGALSALRLLLDNTTMEFDVNEMSSPELFTPLHVVAMFGKIEVVKCLIQSSVQPKGPIQKMDPIARDSIGRTTLHYAAREGHFAVVQELLSNFAMQSTNIASIADYDGLLPLHLAARAGHVKVIELLRSVGSGSHINSQAKHSLELRELLLQLYTSGRNQKIIVVPRKRLGSALHDKEFYMIKSIDESMIAWSKQIDTLFWRTEGYTPLHLAARYGQKEALQELLKEGNVNVELRDSEGFLAFDWMEVQNQGDIFLEYVKREVEGGSNLVDTIKANSQSSKLSEIRRLEISSELDEEKKAMDELQYYACEIYKHLPISFPIVKALLKDMDKSQWLRCSVSEGHIDLLEEMLKLKEIDVNAKGPDGLAALDRAVELKNFEAVRVILLHPELNEAEHLQRNMWLLLVVTLVNIHPGGLESFLRVLVMGASTKYLRKLMALTKSVSYFKRMVDFTSEQPEFKRQLYEDRQVCECSSSCWCSVDRRGGIPGLVTAAIGVQLSV